MAKLKYDRKEVERSIFYDLWKDGYEAGIDRAIAQFSVAVNKNLIGFCPESGITSVVEALDYVLKNCFDEVVEFEKQMQEIRNVTQ